MSSKADSSWHCNGLHTMFRYLNDVRDLESWWESWAALLRVVKATTGTWIWILSRGPENVNGAYSCLHQRDSSLCMFLPRRWGGSQWDLLRLDWKRTISYSAPTMVGKTPAPRPAWLQESFWPSEIRLQGRVQDLLSRECIGDSRSMSRIGTAASWLLSSARLKSLWGLSLAERYELPALMVRAQHSLLWPVIGLFVI